MVEVESLLLAEPAPPMCVTTSVVEAPPCDGGTRPACFCDRYNAQSAVDDRIPPQPVVTDAAPAPADEFRRAVERIVGAPVPQSVEEVVPAPAPVGEHNSACRVLRSALPHLQSA